MRKLAKPVLIFLAVVGFTMAGLQVMSAVTGFRTLPITSDVMEPTIYRGSLLFTEKTSEGDLHAGDIIAVAMPNQQSYSVGRLIASKKTTDGYYNLSFKGDNRALPEQFPYTVKDSTYVTKFSIPLLGFVVFFLSSPFGLILFSAAVIFFAWFYLAKMHDRREQGQRFVRLAAYRELVAQEREAEREQHGGAGLDVFFSHLFEEDSEHYDVEEEETSEYYETPNDELVAHDEAVEEN